MTKGGLLFAFEHSLFTMLLSPRNLIISYTSVKYNPLLNNNEYKDLVYISHRVQRLNNHTLTDLLSICIIQRKRPRRIRMKNQSK